AQGCQRKMKLARNGCLALRASSITENRIILIQSLGFAIRQNAAGFLRAEPGQIKWPATGSLLRAKDRKSFANRLILIQWRGFAIRQNAAVSRTRILSLARAIARALCAAQRPTARATLSPQHVADI